jgi:hypothetical protein
LSKERPYVPNTPTRLDQLVNLCKSFDLKSQCIALLWASTSAKGQILDSFWAIALIPNDLFGGVITRVPTFAGDNQTAPPIGNVIALATDIVPALRVGFGGAVNGVVTAVFVKVNCETSLSLAVESHLALQDNRALCSRGLWNQHDNGHGDARERCQQQEAFHFHSPFKSLYVVS